MQPNLDLMSVTELKALAFDQLVQIEQCQVNIKTLNQKIADKSKAKPQEKPLELSEKE